MIKITLNSTHVSAINCFSEYFFFNNIVIIKHYLHQFSKLCSSFFVCVLLQGLPKPSHSSGSRPSELKIVHPFPAGNLQNIDTDVACEWIPLKAAEAGRPVSAWLRVFPSWDIIRLRLHLSPSSLAGGRLVTRPLDNSRNNNGRVCIKVSFTFNYLLDHHLLSCKASHCSSCWLYISLWPLLHGEKHV